MRTFLSTTAALLVALALILIPPRSPRVVVKRHERNLTVRLVGAGGRPVRLAIEVAASTGGTAAPPAREHSQGSAVGPASLPADDLARLIGEVLRQDLAFEGAFEVLPAAPDLGRLNDAALPSMAHAKLAGVAVPPTAHAKLAEAAVPPTAHANLAEAAPPARAHANAGKPPVPEAAISRWRELGADGLVTGAVSVSGSGLEVDIRIYKASTGEEAFARGYLADAAQARMVAHTVADEIHHSVAGVRGIARTRLAFVSDRGGMRRELGGMMRRFKEIWIADYDGANERRVTSDGDLDMTPTWSPDGRAIAYTSLRPGFQDIFITLLDEHRVLNPTKGTGTNRLPAWSPDGARIAFASVRDGNEEIYVMNRDGSAARRITHHPAIDTAPAWSPDGAQIAFTSNRTGSPQIWVMNADGTSPRALTSEKYCDRPTWSPPPFNEIAYVSKTTTGFDIKVIDAGTGQARQLTFGHGFNESPAFSPNGRHIAFKTTRHGGEQIWVMSRTGEGLRQVTTIGNNTMPAWR